MEIDCGVNFSELVNFASTSWLPFGRSALSHDRDLGLGSIFSHDEMLCKIASDAESLEVSLAEAVLEDLSKLFQDEVNFRKKVSEKLKRERQAFELVDVNDRRCKVCKSVIFMSAFTCSSHPGNLTF